MRLNIYERAFERRERNVSGLITERYKLLPRCREDTDNSPQIHPNMATEIGCCPDGGFELSGHLLMVMFL